MSEKKYNIDSWTYTDSGWVRPGPDVNFFDKESDIKKEAIPKKRRSSKKKI
jgi:hypothetical protein